MALSLGVVFAESGVGNNETFLGNNISVNESINVSVNETLNQTLNETAAEATNETEAAAEKK